MRLCVLLGLYLLSLGVAGNSKYNDGKEGSSRDRVPKDDWEKQRNFDHKYGKDLKVECNTRRGEAIYRVESKQEGANFDRIWKWSCKRVVKVPLTNCKWTNEINELNGPISFMCPMNQVIAGVSSVHRPIKEDREWKIQCCGARGYHTEGCTMTDFLNKMKEHFTYHSKSTCASTRVFTGFVTDAYVSNIHDRRWKIMDCALTCDNLKSRRDYALRSRGHLSRHDYYVATE